MQLRRSLLITFLSTNFATAVGFGVVVVLSRLLTPAEVGIFSIAVVFVNITAVFRDFGISNYLRQKKVLSRETMRSALGLLITTGWSLALLLYLLPVRDVLATMRRIELRDWLVTLAVFMTGHVVSAAKWLVPMATAR